MAVVSKHNHKPIQVHQTLRVSLTRSKNGRPATDRLCKQTFQGPISVNGGSEFMSVRLAIILEGRQLRDFINYGEALWTVGQVEAVPHANANMQLLGNMKSFPNSRQNGQK